jgi:oxygen-dependent protoporphyrinogen oxidase
VFFGGAAPEIVELGDDELLQVIRSELAQLLSIRVEPIHWAIFRWPRSFPQADVGHLERVGEIEAALPAGILLCGSSYRGIGVPDCIRQGRDAARQALSQVNRINTDTVV